MKKTLTGTRILLEEISIDDATNVHALHSLPETDRYNTLGIPADIEETRALVQGWIAAQQESPRVKYVFRVEDKEGAFIGIVGINIGKPKYRTAELWYKLHPSCWNKGYATETVLCLLRFLFSGLKLHRVTAGCATENIASVKVLEKCGFTKEGSFRKVLPIRGEWYDNYEYAILEEEFFA